MIRLLVAVDGSDNAMRAVRAVVVLAQRGLPLEVVLCNVQPDIRSGEVGMITPVDVAEAQRRRAADAAIAAASVPLENAGITVDWLQVSGDAAQEIALAAHQRGCDTVVVGRRGLSPLAGVLLGSVSARVARLSEVPVMVVP